MTSLLNQPSQPMSKAKQPRPPSSSNATRSKPPVRATAETMAADQREISVSEFFAKNRHLLGFDNPRKALLTTVKEAVDNALDACEEAGILPDIDVADPPARRDPLQDHACGTTDRASSASRSSNIFGKLLYGSKFHRLKMSPRTAGHRHLRRGHVRAHDHRQARPDHLARPAGASPPTRCCSRSTRARTSPEIVSDTEHPEDDTLFPEGHGTQVVIELEGRYQKGRQSIDEYLEQTAIANPHARITYVTPSQRDHRVSRARSTSCPRSRRRSSRTRRASSWAR